MLIFPTCLRADIALLSLGIGLMLLFGLLLPMTQGDHEARQSTQNLVRDLQLTDLSLFTEIGYTRHPSQSDLHAPFQHHPLALDYYPSGSLVHRPLPINKDRNPVLLKPPKP